MKKVLLSALTIGLFLLTGCGFVGGREEHAALLLQEEYGALTACTMEAQVRYDDGFEVTDYSLSCAWTPEKSEIEILEPELLAGITAEVDPTTMKLVYGDLSLPVGKSEQEGLSPATVLPQLMQVVREGYLLEQGVEKLDGSDCVKLVFDPPEELGNYTCVLWFGKDHAPLRGEIYQEGTMCFGVDFSTFSAKIEEKTEA